MGAWGTRSFDNDTAHDWLNELVEAEDDGPMIEAFERVLGDQAEDYVDADDGSAALAAAEVVAALMGRPCADLPPDLSEWVSELEADVVETLLAKHREWSLAAIKVVRTRGEFAELWSESDQKDAWHAALQDLSQRLGEPQA